MKRISVILAGLALFVLSTGVAHATASGYVYCDANDNGQLDSNDTPLEGVEVFTTKIDGGFYSVSDFTDVDGYFAVELLDSPDALYEQTIFAPTLPADAVILIPAGGSFQVSTFDDTNLMTEWLIRSEECIVPDTPGECWFTGGGHKYEASIDMMCAEHGKDHSFGGNVFPACTGTSGAQGGHWNHIAHRLKWRFQGNPIDGVECGNVVGIPPGSTSPVTPFNYINFWGTGSLSGIKGNHTSYDLVYFWARAEDHNEPGSEGPADGDEIDRYFLWVWTNPIDPVGTVKLLVDVDGNPATLDPVTISGGNFQLHFNPCD